MISVRIGKKAREGPELDREFSHTYKRSIQTFQSSSADAYGGARTVVGRSPCSGGGATLPVIFWICQMAAKKFTVEASTREQLQERKQEIQPNMNPSIPSLRPLHEKKQESRGDPDGRI